MTSEDIAKAAAKGIMPDGMNCPERCLYYALKDIYEGFKRCTVTKAEGEKRKLEVVIQFSKDMAEYELSKKIIRNNAEMWKEIESAGYAYNMNPSVELANEFVEAVYRVRRKHGE